MRWVPAVLTVALSLASVPSARGDDDVSVRATVEPATVAVGEQAVLTIEVQGKFRKSASPDLPALGAFDIYQAGTSQSFSFINGQATSSITYTYVLVPRDEGSYRIEPIRFSAGGSQYTANPVTIDVVSAARGVPAPPPASSSGGKPPRDLPSADESIFVSASVDRDTAYVNQQVTWTLGYYTDGRVELLRSPNYSPPSAEGFWVEDLPPQNKYYTNLHNRQYLVSEIKRGLFPTAPGEYTIGEARVDIVVDDIRSRGSIDDFFNRGFFGGFGQSRTLQTRPVRVVVLPLPERGKPGDFRGAVVTDLAVSVSADKQVAQVGEPVNVSVEMNGVGNMRTLMPPSFEGLGEFKVYESGSSTDVFKRDYLVSGRRKYEFVLVPQAEGRFTIPPVRVSYFDPARGRYGVAQSAPVPVEVKPGAAEDGRKLIYAGGGDDFRVINRDIRFIHAVPAALTTGSRPFYASRVFIALQALPALAVAASLVIERRRRRLRSDVGFARASRAFRDASHQLGQAERAFRLGDGERGFALVQGAIYGYFADRMNVARAGLTDADLEAYLRERGMDTAVVDAVARVIAACNAARYAAAAPSPAEGSKLAAEVRRGLGSVEKGLR